MSTPDDRYPLRGALHLTDTELAVADAIRWQVARPAVIDVLRDWCAEHGINVNDVPVDALIRRLPDEGAVETEVLLRGEDGRLVLEEGKPARVHFYASVPAAVVAPWPEDLWALTATGGRS